MIEQRLDRLLNIGLVSAFDYASHGGVQSHIRQLAAQFESWGHRVRVIGPCSDTDKVLDSNFIPMGKPVPIPSQGSVARISISIWLRPRIKKMLDEQAFDILHLHEPFSSYVPVGCLAQSQTVTIATFHAYPGSMVYEIGGAKLAQPYFRKLDGWIAVSEPARDFISEHFPADYEIVPNGISLDQFTDGVEPFPNLQDGMINLLFLGRLEKRKGLRYLLAAYSKLKWDWPNLRLLVVGPGTPDEESSRIISERNLQDVVFLGGVSDEDKVRFYKSADLYCSPATGGESFGIVLLEAMASSKPIVATSIPGFSSVMTDGKEGLMVPPKDGDALADAIHTLLSDPERSSRMAAQGRATAEEFQWQRVATRVMDYYQVCLDRAAASPRPASHAHLF